MARTRRKTTQVVTYQDLEKIPLPVGAPEVEAKIGELHLLVPESERGEAYFLVDLYMNLRGFDAKLTRIKHWIDYVTGKKKKKVEVKLKRTMTKKMLAVYVNKLKEFVNFVNVEKIVENFVTPRIDKYSHLKYLALTGLITKKALVCLIADPPQITHIDFGQLINPISYIQNHFIPCRMIDVNTGEEKVTGGLVPRMFYSQVRYYLTMFPELIQQYPRLYTFYNETINKYLKLGKNQKHAKKLALRDVVRIVIGCMWLLWTYCAWKKGILTQLSVPKYILHDLNRLINPIELLNNNARNELENLIQINLKEVTWHWLVDEYCKQIRKRPEDFITEIVNEIELVKKKKEEVLKKRSKK